jgi:hypothetical protein
MLASQLPTLDAPLPAAVKHYPETPRRSTSAGERGVTGRLEQTVTLIPSQAGTFTVPAFELNWWNTKADRLETLRLPAHTFQVTVAPGSAGAEDVTTEAGTPTAEPDGEPGATRWINLGLAIAWLATLVLWWLDRRRRAGAWSGSAGPSVESRRQAEKRLRVACRGADPQAARGALLAWGRAQWPDRPLHSLGALARLVNDDVAAEIATLQEALYAPGNQPWQGEKLFRAVAASRPAGTPDGGAGGLRPLYQH